MIFEAEEKEEGKMMTTTAMTMVMLGRTVYG